MQIPDLSKIDIKDVDFTKLKDQLLERKPLLVQIGVVIASLVMIFSIFSKGREQTGSLNSQMSKMRSKTDAIAEYKKVQNDIDTFLKEVPLALSEDQIIPLVTDLADKHDVKIITFSPAKVEEKKNASTTILQFSLEAKDYKDMVRFIADIEHGKNLLQVKTCTAQAQVKPARDQRSPEVTIPFRVDVASVKVKL